jgi:Rrf2 family protein
MLTITSKHALRALAHLASLPEGKTLLGKDLAKMAEIPPNYLSKILWALGSAGIIDATRGSGGGYRLSRRPERIRLIDVVELFDKPRVKPGCFLWENRDCSDGDPCTAHEMWRDVGAAYIRFLESTTLADISAHAHPVPAGEGI